MTTRRSLLTSFLSFPLAAADFWQAKKPSEWSAKEIKQLLTGSQWSKDHELDVPQKRTSGTTRQSTSSRSNTEHWKIKGPKVVTTTTRKVPVRITWASAKPIKLAIAQKNYGVEAGSRPEVISAVERVESDYIITVDGIPSNAARQGPDEAAASIEERCTLRCAGKTDRIPTKAKITQGEIGTLALITFPRNEPYSLGGKEVEFTIKLGSDTLRQRFKLKDMVFDGKLEL